MCKLKNSLFISLFIYCSWILPDNPVWAQTFIEKYSSLYSGGVVTKDSIYHPADTLISGVDTIIFPAHTNVYIVDENIFTINVDNAIRETDETYDLLSIKLKEIKLNDEEKWKYQNDPVRFAEYEIKGKKLRKEYEELEIRLNLLHLREDSIVAEQIIYYQGNLIFPVKYLHKRGYAKAFNRRYYGNEGFRVLQGIDLTGNRNLFNLNTELLSDYMGIFRFAFYGTMSSSNDTMMDIRQTDVQRYMTGGGQFALTISLPVVIFSNSNNHINFSLLLHNRLATDALALGQYADEFPVNNQIYPEYRMAISTDHEKFSFFGSINYGYTFGNDIFYDHIGSRDFTLGQVSFGVTFASAYRLKISGPYISTNQFLKNQPFQLGFQLYTPAINK